MKELLNVEKGIGGNKLLGELAKMILLLYLMCLIMPLSTLAHSGRTDSSGGHRDNKNASGLGSYHYHCGGYPAHLHKNGVCPYKSGGSGSGSSNSTPSTPKPVTASRVDFENKPTEINIGETHTVKGAVYPNNAVNKAFTWKSSNENVATITSNGAIKGVGVGTTTITATTSNGAVSSFSVKISEVIATSLTINNIIEHVKIGDSEILKTTIEPGNTTYKNINWTSSNEDIVIIDNTGKLTALKIGETMITASQKDVEASFNLTVIPIEVDSINIIITENRVLKGETLILSTEILPQNATDKSIKWEISNSNKATIEDDVLIALETGNITIKAISSNGKTSTIEIEVYSNIIMISLLSVLGVGGIGGGIFALTRKKKIN